MAPGPNAPDMLHALLEGVQHHQAGQLPQAEALYRRVLQAQPDNADALHYLGILALQIGKSNAAIPLFEQAIRVNPKIPDFHNNLGNAWRQQGENDKAIASYKSALALKPDYAEVHYNLGNALHAQTQYDEACASYEKALALNPHHADAHNNLGNVLQESGHPARAIAHYQRAIALRHDFAAAYNNLGASMQELGRLVEAIENHRKAIRIKPDYAAAHSNLLFTLNYVPGADPADIYKEHLAFSRQHEKPLASSIEPHRKNCADNHRLRVGYVSADFRRHSVAYFIEPVLVHHDHTQFELFCYANHSTEDDTTHRLKQHADHWLNIATMPDVLTAQRIREDQIDILVDLSGHTSHNRLLVFARKPAPVQVTWLGYPNTTGLSAMDYRITDAYADPPHEADQFHTEKLIRMPECFSCYLPPLSCPEIGELPAIKNDYVTFASFNTFAKINPDVIATWAKLLHAVPRSHLMLKYRAFGDLSIRQHVLDAFMIHGIPPERLEILDRDVSQISHLERYNHVDVALDPFPYNGTTTTCDALWMGAPVVTLAGRTHAARVGVSQLNNLGLSELVAETPARYLEIAAGLAKDTARLGRLRRELRARMAASPLTNAARFARQLENIYHDIWEKWCLG